MKSEMKREERDEEMKKRNLVRTYVKPHLVLSQIPFTDGLGGGVSVKVYRPTYVHYSD